MPTAAKPNFTISDGIVLIADVGKIGGELDVFCCATDITIEQTSESEDIVCDPKVGLADRYDYMPRATVTIRELNFNPTVLERALALTSSYNANGYRLQGVSGGDQTTTPTALSQVDGGHAVSAGANTIALSNTLILSSATFATITAWRLGNDGIFYDDTSNCTFNYAHANMNLPTGEIYFTYAGAASVLYFTYLYQPMTAGSRELKNPWNLAQTDVFLRIMHEHANGTEMWIFDFWRARARTGATLNLKSLTGDRVVATEMVFDVLADQRYHDDSDLFTVTVDVIDRTITPDYSCAGAAYATPIA